MVENIYKAIALVAVISAPLALAHLPSMEFPSADVARASIFTPEWRRLGTVNVDEGGVHEINLSRLRENGDRI